MRPEEEALHPDTPPARLWEIAVSHYDPSRVDLLLVSIAYNKKIPVIKALKSFSRASLYTVKKWTDDMPCFINRRGMPRADAERVQSVVRAEGGEIELRPKVTPTAQAILVAQNPSAPPELLWALGACDEKSIRESVIQHPLLPQPLLFFLGTEFPQLLLQNPMIQLDLLEDPDDFLQWPEPVRLAVLSLPDIGENVLRRMLSKGSMLERKAVIGHPSLADTFFDEMSRSDSVDIRQELALSTRTSREILERLAQDADSSVRAAVASNPNTPVEALLQMRGVDAALAKNPSVPLSFLLQLASTGSGDILFYLQRRTSLTPEILEELSRHDLESVRLIAASHQNTDAAVLVRLADDPSEQVVSAVAMNTKTPPESLARLVARQQLWLTADAATNPNTPQHLLPEIVHQLKDTGRREAILQNPNLPEQLCREQLETMPLPVRRSYASNTPHLGILGNLARDPNREVRVAVAQNPNTPQALLDLLAKDPEPTIQQQVTLRYQANIQWE